MRYLKIKTLPDNLPVTFHLIRKIDLDSAFQGQEIRRAESKYHQTPFFVVGSFYKPIARLNLSDDPKK